MVSASVLRKPGSVVVDLPQQKSREARGQTVRVSGIQAVQRRRRAIIAARCPAQDGRLYSRTVPTIDLPDDDLAAVMAAILGVIEGDRYPPCRALIPCGPAP